MSFCPNCGTQNAEGTAFCSNCGTALNAQPAPFAEQPAWEQPAPVAQQSWEQPVEPAAQATLPTAAKIMSIISMACGIASVVLCCYGTLFAVAAIVLSILSNKQTPVGVENKMAKVGLITGIIGGAIGVVFLIISFFGGFLEGLTNSSSYYYY